MNLNRCKFCSVVRQQTLVTNILWFRRDFRLADQEIVTKGTVDAQAVLPCFIIDPWFYTWSDVGKARVRFLFESLENLDCNLRQRGSKLYLFEGNAVKFCKL